MKLEIAGIVVLYHPNNNILENIFTYINDISKLYVVDNSERKNNDIINVLQKHPKIIYIDNNGNQGISHALNTGFQEAIKDQYDYLLAMDQDSRFKQDDFNKLLKSIENNENIGIYAPLAFDNEMQLFPFADKISITSGSIFSLDAYKKVGPFNSDLFIDSVDTEYCLRMQQKGYTLKRNPFIVLEHKLGETKKVRFLFWHFYTTNHSSLRRYYMTRNRFYLWKKFKADYPEFIRFDKISAVKELIKVLLVEEHKFDKIRMSVKGYFDYKKNKYGKYLSGK